MENFTSTVGPVKAGGLTPRQLELVLQELLRRTYMKIPRWRFCSRVAEPSRLGRRRGEETRGIPNRGTKTVLELLSMAEGLADDAGDTVLVMRGASTAGSIGRDNAEQESQKDGQDRQRQATQRWPANLPASLKRTPPEIVE